jgi:hypothetical protein
MKKWKPTPENMEELEASLQLLIIECHRDLYRFGPWEWL